jgi:phosphoenolpyruvate phosphomutase
MHLPRSDRLQFDRQCLVRILGVHDPLSAIVASAGAFDALWVSSLGVSTAYFGFPDVGLLTLSEMLEVVRRIRMVSPLPVIVDADTGYGGLLNLVRLTREAEAGGIDALCIEDAEFPKRNSFLDAKYRGLVETSVMCDRLAAVRESRESLAPMLLARTEVLTQNGTVDEALRRAESYVRSGADAVVVQTTAKDGVDILRFAAEWERRAPLIVIPTAYPHVPLAKLERAGVAGVILANQLLRAAYGAMGEVYHLLASAAAPVVAEERISSVREVHDAVGTEAMLAVEARLSRLPRATSERAGGTELLETAASVPSLSDLAL